MLATICGILADSSTSSVRTLKKTYNIIIQCKSSLFVVLKEYLAKIASLSGPQVVDQN